MGLNCVVNSYHVSSYRNVQKSTKILKVKWKGTLKVQQPLSWQSEINDTACTQNWLNSINWPRRKKLFFLIKKARCQFYFYKTIDAFKWQLQTSKSHKAVRFVLMKIPFLLTYLIIVTSLFLSHNNRTQIKCANTQLKL